MVIPGLSTKSRGKTPANRFLRRPRAPVFLPPLHSQGDAEDEEEESSKKFSGYESPIKMFQDSFELDALQGVNVESEIPTDRGSFVPSIASPPPSENDPNDTCTLTASRQSKHPVRVNVLHTFTSPGSGATFISQDDMKYVLDPLYRNRTSLGTYVDGKSLVKPFKPRGPDPLPPRAPKRNPDIILTYDADDQRFYEPPAFMLEHFVYRMAERKNLSVPRVRKIVYSKHNVKKLTDMLAIELTKGDQDSVHTVNVDCKFTKVF